MAGFVDRLSPVFNPPAASRGFQLGAAGMGGDEDYLGSALSQMEPYFHKIRNRNLADRQAMMDQDDSRTYNNRMREMFDPTMRVMRNTFGSMGGGNNLPLPGGGGGGMNVVYDPTPERLAQAGKMNDYQRASIDLEHKKLRSAEGLNRDRLARDDAEFGLKQEDLSLRREGHELDKLKNKQIYDMRGRELEQRALEAEKKLEQARAAAEAKGDNAAAQLALRQAQLDALNARHEAQLAQRELEAAETKRLNDARIADLEGRGRGTTTTEELTDDTGRTSTKRTTTRRNGSTTGSGLVDGTVRMTHPDRPGQVFNIPKNEAAAARKDGFR